MILHLYDAPRRACVERLNGMFAFALWDPAAASCSSRRDPSARSRSTGPSVGGRLVFGSEIKAILAHPAVDAEVDGRPWLPTSPISSRRRPRTLFGGIRKLAAGHRRLCSNGGVRVRRYRR